MGALHFRFYICSEKNHDYICEWFHDFVFLNGSAAGLRHERAG
jgi:hypothetical protein